MQGSYPVTLGRGHAYLKNMKTYMDEVWAVIGAGINVRGNALWVDSNTGSDSDTGANWTHALASITKALTLADDNDIVLCAQGDYNEKNLTILQKGLKLIGLSNTGLQRGGALIYHNLDTLIKIKADNVEIAGFGFIQDGAFDAIDISLAAWVGYTNWRSHIHHCHFGGDGQGLYAIQFGGVGNEAPHTVVEDCQFFEWVTASIRMDSGASTVRRNQISVRAAAKGIIDVPNAADKPYRWILGNKIITTDVVNAVGISVINTPNPGQLMIDDNHLVNFADAAHAIDVSGSGKTGLMGLNYHGITAIPIS